MEIIFTAEMMRCLCACSPVEACAIIYILSQLLTNLLKRSSCRTSDYGRVKEHGGHSLKELAVKCKSRAAYNLTVVVCLTMCAHLANQILSLLKCSQFYFLLRTRIIS